VETTVDAHDADADTWKLPRDSRRSKPELIEEKIEDLIARGTLQHDESLPGEQELARRFGVGRSSVRTALQRLELRRRVAVEHGVGWRVTAAPPRTVDDEEERLLREAQTVVEARIGLEAHAARLAAQRVTEKDLKEIEGAHERHAAAVRADDVEEMVRTDEELHRWIIRAARNDLIEKMYRVVEGPANAYRRRMFAQYGKQAMRRSVDGHAILIRFLHHRDPSAAVAMEDHIKTFAPR
jgi:GntR family transcriptional repressor for pyruvate dehydrogenase complex